MINLEEISQKDLLEELRIHMKKFNERMEDIKNPHKLLEVLLTYAMCVTYDVLIEDTNGATMLIGASWGRVVHDVAKEKGMSREDVFFQADVLGNLAGSTPFEDEIKKYAKNKYNISEEDVQAAAEDLGILDVEPESKTKH